MSGPDGLAVAGTLDAARESKAFLCLSIDLSYLKFM